MAAHQRCKSFVAVLVFFCFSAPFLIADSAPASGRVGIGIALSNNGQVVVQAVLPGSPAEAAGIIVGDIVMEINGDAVEGHPPDELARLISGPAGTEVTLLIWHTSKRTTEKIVLKRVKDFASPHSTPSNGNLAAAATAGTATHTPTPPSRTSSSAAPSSGAQRFQRFGFVDASGTGTEAYHMSIPAGWKGEGRIIWDVERKAFPASVAIRARSSDGAEEFDYFPFMLFAWSPMIAQVTRGGRYLGAEVVQPVDGPLAALRQVVIPRFRSQIGSYNIISAEELPKLAQAAAALYQMPGVPSTLRAGRIRIEYMEGVTRMQEELTCIYFYFGGPSGANWSLDQITAYKAPKEKLDSLLPIFHIMTFSIQPDMAWYNEYQKVTQVLLQGFYQDQAQIMQRVQIERQKNDAISATIRKEYQSRQSAMDRIHENYDTKAVRGVQLHVNPFDGSTEEAPNEYGHVWVNALGEHIYTNESSYNPNVGSNLDWREMPERN